MPRGFCSHGRAGEEGRGGAPGDSGPGQGSQDKQGAGQCVPRLLPRGKVGPWPGCVRLRPAAAKQRTSLGTRWHHFLQDSGPSLERTSRRPAGK